MLGRIYLARNEFALATEYIEKAASVIRHAYGEDVDHPYIAEISQFRAECKFQAGKYYDARKEIGRALGLRVKFQGSRAVYDRSSDSSVAVVKFLKILEDLAREERVAEASAAIVAKAAAPNSVLLTADMPTNLILKSLSVENDDKAAVAGSNFVIDEDMPDDDAEVPEFLGSEKPIGELFNLDEKPPAIVFDFKGKPVSDHQLLVDCLYHRGLICFHLGDYEEAQMLLEGAITMCSNMFGKDSLAAVRCYQVIVQIKTLLDDKLVVPLQQLEDIRCKRLKVA